MFTALVTTRSITSITSFIISSFVVNVCLWVRVWPIARCCVPTNESKWTASTPPPPWPPPQLAIRLPHVARSELINLARGSGETCSADPRIRQVLGGVTSILVPPLALHSSCGEETRETLFACEVDWSREGHCRHCCRTLYWDLDCLCTVDNNLEEKCFYLIVLVPSILWN